MRKEAIFVAVLFLSAIVYGQDPDVEVIQSAVISAPADSASSSIDLEGATAIRLPRELPTLTGTIQNGLAGGLVSPPSRTPRFGNDRPFVSPLDGYRLPGSALYMSSVMAIRPIRVGYMNSDDFGINGTIGLSERLSISSNVFMSTGRYVPRSRRFYSGTVNATVAYRINDRLSVKAYGQYSTSPHLTSSALSTSVFGTNYGAALSYDAASFLSIEGGVSRTFYMGQWLTNYYAYPVLHIGGLSIPIPVFNYSPDYNDRLKNQPSVPAQQSGHSGRYTMPGTKR